MLPHKVVNFFKVLNSKKIKNNPKNDKFITTDRLGFRLAEYYSTRFDILSIDKCIFLSNFTSRHIKKEEKHLLQLIPKFSPIYSLMEYFDNYPFSYSDINYSFKGCLKSGVEIAIKVSNKEGKTNIIKRLNGMLKNIKYSIFFRPYLEKKFKIKETIGRLEEILYSKVAYQKEIHYTFKLKDELEMHREEMELSKINFPNIYVYLSDENVIVSQYIYGDYFFNLLLTHDISYTDTLTLIRAQLFYMLHVGNYCNNINSGNLLKDESGVIYFLDCNNIGKLEPETRKKLLNFFRAIILGNYPYACSLLNELTCRCLNSVDMEELEIASKNIMNNYKKSYQEVFFIKIMKIFRCANNLGMCFDDHIYELFKSLMYLDNLLMHTMNKNDKIKTDILEILEKIEKLKK